MFLLDGKPLNIDAPFEHEGVRYPSNWLRLTSLGEKEAIGITEVPEPENYDGRFYLSPGVARNLSGVKTEYINRINESTNSLLKETDWYVIRKIERSIDIPSNVTSYKEAIITESKRLTSGISSARNVAAVADLIDSYSWPQAV